MDDAFRLCRRQVGLDVVAEGVENEEQRAALADLQCGSAQGFLFARPEPADRAGACIGSSPRVVPSQPGPPAIERLEVAPRG